MVIVEETKRRRKYVLKQYKNLAYILRQRRNVRILNVKSVGVQVKDVKMMIHDRRDEFTDLYSRKICRDGLNNDEEYIIIRKSSEKNKNIMYEILKADWLIKKEELDEINSELKDKFNVEIEVVSQEDEADFTALGCYSNINYEGNICVFIGGGGSTELIFVNNGNIIDKKYYDFGVVDITSKFPSLKNDVPNCTFDEVYNYINELIGEVDLKADVLILAGGDHFYWYNNAKYELIENTIYENENQRYMITTDMSDKYDRDALVSSLDRVRQNSDNPKWFDGSRAMKVTTNLVSHKVEAKYIIPTKINMEDGLKNKLISEI